MLTEAERCHALAAAFAAEMVNRGAERVDAPAVVYHLALLLRPQGHPTIKATASVRTEKTSGSETRLEPVGVDGEDRISPDRVVTVTTTTPARGPEEAGPTLASVRAEAVKRFAEQPTEVQQQALENREVRRHVDAVREGQRPAEAEHHPECSWAPGEDASLCSCAGRGPVYRNGPIPDGAWTECCAEPECDLPGTHVRLTCTKHRSDKARNEPEIHPLSDAHRRRCWNLADAVKRKMQFWAPEIMTEKIAGYLETAFYEGMNRHTRNWGDK